MGTLAFDIVKRLEPLEVERPTEDSLLENLV